MEGDINNNNIRNANHLIVKRKKDYKVTVMKISMIIALSIRLIQSLMQNT